MSDERVWLRHNETGHFFACPASAVEDWAGLGWQPTGERPAEYNPVLAERDAWLAARAREQQSTTAPAGPDPETEE